MRFGKTFVVTFISGAMIAVGVGCQDKQKSVTVEPVQTTTAKDILHQHAQSGQPLGSEALAIYQELDQLQQTNPAKAERLRAQLDQLVSTNDPRQIRQRAAAMAREL